MPMSVSANLKLVGDRLHRSGNCIQRARHLCIEGEAEVGGVGFIAFATLDPTDIVPVCRGYTRRFIFTWAVFDEGDDV